MAGVYLPVGVFTLSLNSGYHGTVTSDFLSGYYGDVNEQVTPAEKLLGSRCYHCAYIVTIMAAG